MLAVITVFAPVIHFVDYWSLNPSFPYLVTFGRDLCCWLADSSCSGKACMRSPEAGGRRPIAAKFGRVLERHRIMLLDIVFSLDSVITAVGMVDHVEIMIAAVVIAAVVMVFTATPLGNFVERHPTIKMLALSFLLLIGFTLIVEGLHQHIPKGYIYFAMGFSVFVEMLNLRLRERQACQFA
jgi:predicted tellurium resistance membrane protein TerC